MSHGDEKMRKIWLLAILSLTLIVSACGNEQAGKPVIEEDQAKSIVESGTKPEKEKEKAPKAVKKEDSSKKGKADSSTNGDTASGDNLLKEDWVAKYEDDDVVTTINVVEFTNEFTTTSGDDNTKNSLDSDILFHIKGVINNDTIKQFSFGHSLAPLTFKLVYDNKHELPLLSVTEAVDGKTFEGSYILPLEEQIFHTYAQVPLPVAKSGKSLVLVISYLDDVEEVQLR